MAIAPEAREEKVQQNGHNNNHHHHHEAVPLKTVREDEDNDKLLVPTAANHASSEQGYVEMVVPPDGGWGWVVVVASFMCNLIVDGIMFSFQAFMPRLKEAFGATEASVAVANSLQTGFYLMAGPFVSAMANRYGFRPVTMLGSFVTCIAFVLSSQASSIEFIYISYGILGGIGAGMIYVPAVITTGFYFEKRRAFATGIAVCGSGIGGFLLNPVSEWLIKNYDWDGALLWQAGMLLQCAVFGTLFRPLKPTRVKVTGENLGVDTRTTLLARGQSTVSLHTASQPLTHRIFGTNANTEYPTAAQVLGSNPDILNNSSRSLHSLNKTQELQSLERHKSNSEKHLSVPIYPELEPLNDEELKSVEEENNLLDGDAERLNGKVPTIRRHTISDRRSRADSVTSHKSFKVEKRRGSTVAKEPQRPFYRDDIFYGGSLNRLPHYRSQLSSVGYHMSVTRLPTAQDLAEEESGTCYLCPESVRRILTTMLDLKLLKSPSFLILAVSGCLTMMGFYTPFLFVQARAKLEGGMNENTTTWLVPVIGIGNTIGRVALGYVSSLPGVDALMINNVFITVCGLLTALSSLSLSVPYQFFYAGAFGLSVSVFSCLRSILVVDLMGLEKLTNAFGLLLLFQGVGAVVGAPLAGVIKDLSSPDQSNPTYANTFWFAGTLIVISAVICYPLKRINQWENQRELEKSTDPTKS